MTKIYYIFVQFGMCGLRSGRFLLVALHVAKLLLSTTERKHPVVGVRVG
jgi:hypothetical protein